MTAIEIPPTPAMIHVETLEVPSKIENTAASTGPIQKLFKAKGTPEPKAISTDFLFFK